MKKIKFLITLLVLAVAMVTVAACNDTDVLTAPKGLSIDLSTYTLSWGEVDDARGYIVEITPVDSQTDSVSNETRRISFSLESLIEGDYDIRVMAVGGRQNSVKSEWSQPISFHREHESGCVYSLINSNTEYELVSAGTASGSFTIEDVYRGKSVTSIGKNAFGGKAGSNIENVVIGSNVTTISEKAFYQCKNLVSVTIPDSVTYIGESAFLGCKSLKQITLPPNITSLETNTFAYCDALETVVLNDNLVTIGEGALQSCVALESIVFPNAVTTVSKEAFRADTALTSVTLGSSLETLGNNVFYGCSSLSSVIFAENGVLTEVGENTFASTALTDIVLPDGVVSLGSSCFSGCSVLKSVVIPESVTSVGVSCFYNTLIYSSQENDGFIYADKWLVGLTSAEKEQLTHIVGTEEEKNTISQKMETANKDSHIVIMNENTVGIADSVFRNCETLLSVTLPSSVKYLGTNAFYNCVNLQTFTMPKGGALLTIGSYALAKCTSLASVNLREGLKEIGKSAFYGDEMLQSSRTDFIPESVDRIRTNAFAKTGFFDNVDKYGVVYVGNWVVGYDEEEFSIADIVLQVPDNDEMEIGGIGDYAFINCSSLSSVTGLNKVLNIGAGAFYMCTDLSVANMNANVKEIKAYTFMGCTSLYSVEFPKKLESVGNYAFAYCSTLSAADFSETNVVSIGNMVFACCTNLKTLDLGTKVESIGNYAFYNCTLLGGNSVLDYIDDGFSIYADQTDTDQTDTDQSDTNETDDLTIVLPDSLTYLGAGAFARCESVRYLTIGSGLTYIPAYAFRNCSSLQKIEIPGNINSIGNYAFFKCSKVEELVISDSVETIGYRAFYGLTSITELELSENVRYVGEQAFRGCSSLTSLIIRGKEKTIGSHAFFGASKMTVYAEASEEEAESWGSAWNTSYRPVMWNCVFEYEGSKSYVVSAKSDEISYEYSLNGIAEPVREGYIFGGWEESDGIKTAIWLVQSTSLSAENVSNENFQAYFKSILQ